MVPSYWKFASVLVFVLCENSVAFLDSNCNQLNQFCFAERSAENFRQVQQPFLKSPRRLVESVSLTRRRDFHSAEDSPSVTENRNPETDVRSSEFRYHPERREISDQLRLDRSNLRNRRDIRSPNDRQFVRNRMSIRNERPQERSTNREHRRVDSTRFGENPVRLTRNYRNDLRRQEKQERNQRLDRVQLNRTGRTTELVSPRTVNREEVSSVGRRNPYGNQIQDQLQERSFTNRNSRRYVIREEIREEGQVINRRKEETRETKHREQRIRKQTEDSRENIHDSRHSRNERIREFRVQRREIRYSRDIQPSLTKDGLDRREGTRVNRRLSSFEMKRRNEKRNSRYGELRVNGNDLRKDRENVRDALWTSQNSEEQRRFSGDRNRGTSRHIEVRQDVTREIAQEDLHREITELSRGVTSRKLSDQTQSNDANEYIVHYAQIPFAQMLQSLLIGALVIKTMMQHEITYKKLSSNIVVGKLGAAFQRIKYF